jgi:TolC family type I secretion outer membrane protein
VEQSLYRGGRTVAGTRRAEASVLAERQVLTSVEQDVLLSAATSYMDVWRDQSVLQLNVSNERVLQRQLEASRDRFEVGEITRTDVAQSESRLARATADRIAAEGDLTASRAVFQEVVGIYPMLLEEPPALEGLPASQDEVIAAAAAAQPDLVSAKFTEEASRHQVRVSLGELFPEVSLNGEIGYEDETSIEDSDAEFYRILAQVTVPLYQQGLVSSRVREDKQIANQRRIEIDQAGRAAEQNAISAWEDLQTGRAQIVSFQSEVDSTRIALEGVRQENAVGARTILDILDAEQEFLDAQVSLVRARRDESVAGYAVLAAMGRLTAGNLGLPVAVYDPIKDYDAVRDKWFGLSIPEE